MSKVKINIGDLVSVDGYLGRVFQVESRIKTRYEYSDASWLDISYDLTDVNSGEYMIAFDEDIRRLASASQAEKYLAENKSSDPYSLAEGTWGDVLFYPYGDGYRPSNESLAKPKPKETKEERIDNLLDIRNWNRMMFEKTGDATYSEKMAEIDAKLADVSTEPQ